MKRAFITGITGQDGSYLAELLLSKGYEVHGLIRRSSTHGSYERLKSIKSSIVFHTGDMTDTNALSNIIEKIQPDEVYNLAAQSHVGESFSQPLYTGQVDALGVLNLLEAVRTRSPKSKVYQASTSELFGKVMEVPQKETTPFYPRSPYGVAKLYALWLIRNYKESYDLFACNGILFNHESPRRGEEFLTRKITKSISQLLKKEISCIFVGNLDSRRDWGHARDYVEGMWLMLQQENPDDYILATGETHSVREWIEESFKYIGKTIEWSGENENEVGKVEGKIVVKVDPIFYRPAEVDLLIGDATKAEKVLNWKPKILFHELVREMMEADLNA